MGDRYTGMIKCPHCGEMTEYLFNDEWGREQYCDKCKKQFYMNMKLTTSKKDTYSEESE